MAPESGVGRAALQRAGLHWRFTDMSTWSLVWIEFNVGVLESVFQVSNILHFNRF